MIAIYTYPRSGSRFTARMLKHLGIAVEQEKLGPKGTVSWIHVGRGKVRGRFVEPVKADVILHQVRYPRYAITSAMTMTKSSKNFISNNIFFACDDMAFFCLKAYIKWHHLIKFHNPQWIYQIEKLAEPDVWEEFKTRVGLPEEAKWTEMGKAARHSRIHKEEDYLTWEQLEGVDKNLTRELRVITKGYGYEDC